MSEISESPELTYVDNGGGEDNSFDPLGVPEPVSNTESEPQAEQSAEEKFNPAWNPLFEALPTEFQKHPKIVDTLKSWDQNFAKVQSEFAPYKPLVENQISMEDIQNSIELTKLLNANPRYVYDELARRYGFASEQGQQQVEEEDSEDEENENTPNLLELENNPQLKAMQEQLNQFQQMFAQQEQAKQEQRIQEEAKAAVQNEWDQLYQSIGVPQGQNLPANVRQEIAQRAVAIGDATGEYSLQKGYEQYAEMVNFVRNSRANNTAPQVMPGNGAMPSTKKNLGQMSEDERVDHIAAMAKALAEGNGS